MKAALSLDLDNQWSYMKTHGDPGWESYPSYLERVIPMALEILRQRSLRITFFAVGLDAANAANRALFHGIANAGHEIGNHSYFHEPWLHRKAEPEIEEEIAAAEESIARACGVRPRGFRGPGFVSSPAIFSVLARRGYAYDASTLPTFIGPLARAYYFRTAKLDGSARAKRGDLYGSAADALQRNRPYTIATPHGSIVELPVTTMPGLRVPVHVSYLLYVALRSRDAALAYFRAALALCRISRTPPSILLHPLDFLGKEDCPALAFFPGMNANGDWKRNFVGSVLDILCGKFDTVRLIDAAGEHFTASSQHYEPAPDS